ncbi:6-bladed beta-propeller [Parabacteroides sp. OttesenSCG-928-K15]|nr:6-bladed beta-propeller [Parabacteroides sp. OttesenSCG-928-K15]
MCRKAIFLLPVVALLVGCGGKKDHNMWQSSVVVAEKTTTNGVALITMDPALLKDTIVFPISHFMGEIEFVKLDDADDALVYPAPVEISDNYILVKTARASGGDYRSSVPIPCKLFDKKGKFISNIGAIGQGPGEYTMIYSMQIDEKGGRIYLLPWQSDKILAYDLSGKLMEPIPMPYRAPKGVFKVDGDRVIVAITPFQNNPSVAWVQDLNGEVIQEFPAGHFQVSDFSNEVFSYQNAGKFDLSFWNYPARVDSLYYIDVAKKELVPQFTFKFEKDKTPESHGYIEWTDYFVGNTSAPVYITDGNGRREEGKKPAFFILDKKTLKGSYFKVANDYFAGGEEGWPIDLFNKGYYVRNVEPANLLDMIEELLKSDKLNEKMRVKLTELQSTIDENDNNYIYYAKMK